MIAALVWGGAAYAAPTTYALNPQKSTLYVVVRNDTSTVASGLGHDHAISPRSFDGRVVWDADDLGSCDVSISFPVSALFPDPPGLREKAGLDPDGAVGDKDKEQIKKNFSKRSQLDAGTHPKIEYRSTSCSPSSTAGRVDVSGTLTIRGVGLPVTVAMQVDADGESFSAAGGFTANHTDFGFKPFTNLLGALRNLNRLEFVVDVTGSKR